MDIDPLVQGLLSVLTLEGILFISGGVLLGILIGALPGLGATVGMAIVLPLVLRYPPVLSISLLMAIYSGSQVGNGLTSVLIGIPGTPSALLTVVESERFRKEGRELHAMTVSVLAACMGQWLAVVTFILIALPLSAVALRFLFPELFAITVVAFITIVTLAQASPLKGLAACLFGFSLGLVGPDPITSQIRYGFGIPELYTGLPLVAALIGLLAFREVFEATAFTTMMGRKGGGIQWPQWAWIKGFRRLLPSTYVGTGAGMVVGALPGAGPAISTFVTYGLMQLNPRWRRQLGKGGSLVGLAGTDAAQNSASVYALLPTLAVGIPGSAPMVIVLAMMTAQGVVPGPNLMTAQPDLINGIFGGLLLAAPLMLLFGYATLPPVAYLTRISHAGIICGSVLLMFVGVYALRWSLTDAWVALVVGVVGYVLQRNGYPIAPAALGLILAPILETNLRRGLVMTRGPIGFITRPLTASMLIGTVVLLVAMKLLAQRSARLLALEAESIAEEDESRPV